MVLKKKCSDVVEELLLLRLKKRLLCTKKKLTKETLLRTILSWKILLHPILPPTQWILFQAWKRVAANKKFGVDG
jgi:hypothetical protein